MSQPQIAWNAQPTPLADISVGTIRDQLEPVNPWRSFVSCVDGRPVTHDGDFVQLLGGELMTIAWIQIGHWLDGKEISFEDAFKKNNDFHQRSHLRIGIHIGPHYDEQSGVTDCGFADNFQAIMYVLGNEPDKIRALINHGAHDNGAPVIIGSENEHMWRDITKAAQNIAAAAQSKEDHAFLSGLEMFDEEDDVAGRFAVTKLKGEHSERFAHVNLRSGTSLNIGKLNKMSLTGFNLDLWYALEVLADTPYIQSIMPTTEHVQLLTLGLYQATERVLRATKPPLPLIISS